jgi:hypothetical protein
MSTVAVYFPVHDCWIGQPAVIPEGLDPVALRPCFSACLPKYCYANIFTQFPQFVNRFHVKILF